MRQLTTGNFDFPGLRSGAAGCHNSGLTGAGDSGESKVPRILRGMSQCGIIEAATQGTAS